MRENNRKSIASIKKFPQFTIMNVIDVQAGLIICASLIFYSLTTDNILNIIVLLILAGASIAMLSGDNSILQKATNAKEATDKAQVIEQARLDILGKIADKKGADVSDIEVKAILDTYFEGVPNKFTDLNQTVTTKSGKYEVSLAEVLNGVNIATSENTGVKDKNGTVIASTKETTPFLPVPTNNEITNNDLNTGLTIKDANQNEWVWIEVPKSVTASASLDDPSTIKAALEHYVYETNAKNESSPLLTKGTSSDSNTTTTYGFTDVNHDGTGLDDDKYGEKYSAMLKSIKANGGFYIGKYEVGYKESNNIRQRSSEGNTSNNAPVIQVDAYPYNWVTNAEAESLSETLTTGMASTEDRKASLMFGIQWDLVLKYLNEKGGLTKADLTSDSEGWGNYDCEYNLNQTTAHGNKGMYAPWRGGDYGTKLEWSVIESGYSHKKYFYQGSLETEVSYYILSTGATERNARLNVYDLAGNMNEWTLEKKSGDSGPCAFRGGTFNSSGTGGPASYRSNSGNSSGGSYELGFRPSLY